MVKFFNVDMHISVIHDIKNIFSDLGHEIKSVNVSNHTWVNRERKGRIRGVSQKNFTEIDQEYCDLFYKRFRNKLRKYDGFIHSYPPAFALLFEKFDKPVITVACTRFDFPTYPKNYDWLIEGLTRMKKSSQLVPVANNLLDKKYCDDNFDFAWEHISSLCKYMGKKSGGGNGKFIVWTRSDSVISDKLIDNSFSIKRKYDRDKIRKYSGVIHLPYNLSIMSAFEQYYQDIPLFFPTQEFQRVLFENRKDMLTEVLFYESALKFDSSYIKYADWYDASNINGVIYFESFNDLSQKLREVNLEEVSYKMFNHNKVREAKVYMQWERIIKDLL